MSKELVVSATNYETRVATLEDDKLVEITIERASEHALAGSIYKGRVSRVLPGMQSAFVKIGLERDAFLYVSDVLEETEEIEKDNGDKAVSTSQAIEDDRSGARGRGRDRGGRRRGGRGRGGADDRDERDERDERNDRGGRAGRGGRDEATRTEAGPEAGPEAGADDDASGDRRRGGRGRRGRRGRGGRGRGGDSNFPDSKYASVDASQRASSDRAEEREERHRRRRDRDEAAAGASASASARSDDVPDDDEGLVVLPGESLAKYSGDRDDDERDSGRDDETPEAAAAEGEDDQDDEQEKPAAAARDGQDDDSDEEDSGEEDSEEDDDSEDDEDESEEEEEDSEEADSEDEDSEDEDDEYEYEYEYVEVDEEDEESEDEESDDSEDEEDGEDSDEEDSDEDESEEEEEDDEDENRERVAASSDEGGDERSDEDDRSGGRRRGRRRRGRRGRNNDAGEAEAGSDDERSSGDADKPRKPVEAGVRDSGHEARPLRGRGRRRRGRGGRGDRDESSSSAEESSRPDSRRRGDNDSPALISDLLKPGQEVIVQVAKEPLGKKGARITSHVALPGRYLVYMPTVNHVGVSRKIASDAERDRLRRIIKEHSEDYPGGFIVRTAGQGAAEDDLVEDIRFLANLWQGVLEKAGRRQAPTVLHRDLDIVERILRDQIGLSFKTIWVDNEEYYERIVEFCERFQPDLLDRVKLYTRSRPIFDEFGITPELEKALRPKVWLKSGGYIVINQTEALVAIDINTGKYVGKSDRLEDTIVKTNLEAVQEIVRQMRLRDLGGIIVVDFIDMDDKSNRKKVQAALEKELRNDKSPSKALAFNDFGLVAITRKRVKQSLERVLCSPCPACQGSGYVKAAETVVFEILEEARGMADELRDAHDVTLRCNPDVAKLLKARDNSYLQELEDVLGANVLVRGDLTLGRENYDIN